MGIVSFHAVGNVFFAMLAFAILALYGYWLLRVLKEEPPNPMWPLLAAIILIYAATGPATFVIGVSRLLQDGPVMVMERSKIASVAFWLITRAGMIFASMVFIFAYIYAAVEEEKHKDIVTLFGWSCAAITFAWIATSLMVW